MAEPAAIARELMEYLLRRLRDVEPGFPINAAPPELHVANGALFALHRVGLVGESDANGWTEALREERKRITAIVEDESQHPAPPVASRPSPDQPSANHVLERQLVKIDQRRQAAAISGRKLSPWNNPSREGAHDLLAALGELGLVSELDERHWAQRIERVADPEAEPLRTYDTQALEAIRVDARLAELFEEQEEPPAHPRPRCSFDRLVDVLVVAAPIEDDARLEAIFLYSDGFVIVWASPPATRGGIDTLPFRAAVSDDLGTYYYPGGRGGGWHSRQRTISHYTFAPAPPAEARELRIRVCDECLIVGLRRSTSGADP